MKQLSKKLISITLIIAMVFSNTITNFAIDDLTLGEKKSVELVSTEGKNELFVATDSETDDENKKLTEEEKENDDDTATASELDDETTKNENGKTENEDEDNNVSTESDATEKASDNSLDENENDNENNNTATISELIDSIDIDNFIATMSELNDDDNTIATISDIEIIISTKSTIKIASNSNVFGNKATTSEIKKHGTGYRKENLEVPIPIKKDDDLFGSSPLPAAYDSRTIKNPANNAMSIIPPLRDQGQHGTCWAFATMGLIETSLRKKGLVTTEEECNLSELALAYYIYNLENITNNSTYIDTPGLEGNDYIQILPEGEDFDSFGGSVLTSALTASTFLGILREDKDESLEYKPLNSPFNTPLDRSFAYDNSDYIIKNAIFLKNSDRNSIKQAIMDYGAVSISYYGDGGGFNSLFSDTVIDGEHYVFPYGDEPNHAIIVVGWDDNVPASNFTNMLYGVSPSTPGAWICKNSWGEYEFGNNGYFYLPYTEPSIGGNFFALDAVKGDAYKYNYHYDTTDSTGSVGFNLQPSFNFVFSNIFKVHSDETLDAITLGVNSANVVFDVLVYTNESAMSEPNDGTLALTQENLSITYPGLYTFDLSTKVNLKKDSYYSIVIRPQSADENKFYLLKDATDISQMQLEDGSIVDATLMVSAAEPGQSFYGSNLGDLYNWSDLNATVTDGIGQSLRIRGLTNPASAPIQPASGVDYVLNPGWYSSTTLSQTLSATDIEKIEIRTYGVDSEPDSSYTSYDIPNSSVNSDNILLKVYNKSGENDIIIYAPKLTSVNKIVTIKTADNASFLFAGDGGTITDPSTPPPISNPFNSLQTIVGLEKLNTSSTTNMQGMFALCSNLENFNISAFDTSNVTDMSYMFYRALKDQDDLDLSNFNTSKVTTFANMFYEVDVKNINVTSFDTSSATNMYMMFCNFGVPHLESIDLSNFNTSNVTNMAHMISSPNISSINVSSFDTSKVTNFEGLFWNMSKLTSIDVSNFDTSSATNIKYMFWGCSGLTTLDLSSFDTSNSSYFENMFENCSNLETITVSNSFTVNGASTDSMFTGCSKLKGPYTDFDDTITDGTYARIDTPTTPGYFTSNIPPASYTINYNAKGGNLTGNTSFTKTIGVPITADLSTPTKTGYTFGGWFVDDETYNTAYDKTNDDIYVEGTNSYTIYAKWTAVTYKIYYKNVDGSSISDGDYVTKTYNSTVTLNTSPTKTGYTFDGWFTDDNTFNDSYDGTTDISSSQDGDKNIYAKWTAHEYSVNYNLGGVSATAPSPITKTYGVALAANTLKNPTNIPTGYTFAGWYKESSFTNEWTGAANDDLTTGTTTQTIYARWKAKITYNANGHGTAPAAVDVYLNNTTPLPSISNVTGYTFDTTNSWYDGSDIANSTLIGASGSNYTVTAPKILYARWNEDEYTITYHNVDSSDGVTWQSTYTPKTSRKYSEQVTLPTASNLSKNDGVNDYIFKGWWTQDGTTTGTWGTQVTEISANTVAPTGGHEFYAKWNAAWKIDFNMLGHGTAPSSITAEQGTKVNTNDVPANPSATGFIFKGWFKNYDSSAATFDAKYTNEWNFSTMNVTENMTLFAKWQPITYTIRYNANGGTISKTSDTKTYDSNLTLVVPTKTGHDFEGWYTDNDTFVNSYDGTTNLSTTNGDTKDIYAKWTAHTYNISFNIGTVGATAPSPVSKTYGVARNAALPSPTNIPNGYEFLGWYKEATYNTAWTGLVADDDLTSDDSVTIPVYAKWKRAIIFNVLHNGVDIGATTPQSQEITGATTINLPSTSATGYTFGGWYKEVGLTNLAGLAGDPVDVDSPTTFYAKWTAKTYTINYNAKDGIFAGSTSFTKTYDTAITGDLVTPTKTGYTFDGWFTDDNTFTKPYNKANDSIYVEGTNSYTIFAKWTAKSYTVNYNPKGGTITGSTSFTKTYGTAITTNLVTPTKTGYTFNGWFVDDNSFNTQYNKANDDIYVEGTNSYTIFAKWTAKTYTINYNAKGGTFTGSISFTKTYDTAITEDLVTPTKTGYTFDGWFTDDNTFTKPYNKANDNIYVEGTVSYNIFAKWNENTYNIIYHNDNLSGVTYIANYTKPTTRKYTQEVTLPTKNQISRNDGTRDYKFDGWWTVDGSTSGNWGTKVEKIAANNTDTTAVHEFYAKWIPVWNVSFNMGGYGVAPATQHVDDKGKATKPSEKPSTEGKRFLGWYDSNSDTANVFNFNSEITSDKVIYAKWQDAITIKFIFDMNGHGTQIDSKFVAEGETLDKPANPTAEGYTFKYWYETNENTAFDFTTNIPATSESIRTLKAKWDANTYTIRYMAKDGTVSPTQVTKTYGVPITNLAKPIRDGYTFVDWFTDDGTFNNKYTGGDLSTLQNAIVNIYAKWNENTYKITLNTNEGTYLNDFTVKTSRKYTEAYTLPTTNDIVKSGFTFIGWFDNEKLEGTAITSIPAKTLGDKTYWLKWEVIKQSSNNSSSNSGSSGGSSSGRSIAALPNAQQQQQQQPNQVQTNTGNIPSTKVSIDTTSVNHINATDNSTWSKDSSGNWHISITNALGQSVEVKNAWCSIRSVKMVDNVPITVDDYYFLGNDGTMLTGWLTDANNKTYYLGTETWNIGRMARGWEKIGDKYYYFNTDGLLVTNSTTPDGYKLDETGAWIV